MKAYVLPVLLYELEAQSTDNEEIPHTIDIAIKATIRKALPLQPTSLQTIGIRSPHSKEEARNTKALNDKIRQVC